MAERAFEPQNLYFWGRGSLTNVCGKKKLSFEARFGIPRGMPNVKRADPFEWYKIWNIMWWFQGYMNAFISIHIASLDIQNVEY